MSNMAIIVCSGCVGFVLGALIVAAVYHFKIVQLKEELIAQQKRYNIQQRVRNVLGGS